MSVEQSSATASAKTVTAQDGRGGVGKGKAAVASLGASEAAPSGFLALLTSFDTPEAVASLPSDLPLPANLTEGLAAPTVVPGQGPVTEVPWSELAMLLGQKMPADVATPLGDAGAAFVLPMGIFAPIFENISVPVLPGTEEPALANPLNAGSFLIGQPVAVAQPLVPMELSGSGPGIAAAPAKLLNEVALPDMTPQSPVVHSRKVGGVEPQLLATTSAAESRALKPTALMDLVVKEPTWSGALVSSGFGTDLLNPASRTPARPLSGVAATGLEGAFAQHALTHGSSSDAVNAAGAALSPEFAVAEQVTYWVSHGVQNAQLKLEGFGAEPVEVSIMVKGQEAQIDFRTDQPELRQMLEGALTQLKETLAREGLVLSGASVGASDQEGAGAQDRRRQPDARQTTVTTNEVGPTVSLQRASPTAGRALDVFV